jgi:hypothetical protein
MKIFKVNEIDDQRFYKIPKSLFGNENYIGLSLEAKVVYSFLRDRMELSRANNWVTENNEIYLLFKREQIAELLEISLPTVTKAFKMLTKHELIIEKRQGLGKPNIIFVCHVALSQENQQKQKILMSGYKETLHQDVKNVCTNDTDLSKTERSETDNKDKGAFSGEERTSYSLVYRIEVNKTRKYFEEYYKAVYGCKYHKHKPSQSREIDERLNWAFNEYGLDLEAMCDMVQAYFRINCDHNLMHFTTEGILQNRMYEVAY